MLTQERTTVREERRALSVALLQHKNEVRGFTACNAAHTHTRARAHTVPPTPRSVCECVCCALTAADRCCVRVRVLYQVAKHREWLFEAMQTVAKEREQGVYQMASEGARLEAQRHAASLSQRNAEYERSVVEKEREALLEHQVRSQRPPQHSRSTQQKQHSSSTAAAAQQQQHSSSTQQSSTQYPASHTSLTPPVFTTTTTTTIHQAELSKQRDAAEKERSSLSEASSKLQSARDAVREMAEETEAQRCVSLLSDAARIPHTHRV